MKVKAKLHTALPLAAACLAAFSARGANYWKGADGADLAAPANWSESALPTAAAGYFNGRSEHGTDYTATLSADTSLYQLVWGGTAPDASDVALDLGGKMLTLTASSVRPMRLENVSSVTITNGTLTFGTASETAWVLGSNQTLTLGAGLTFNGNAAIHAAKPSTNSKIVVHDGAKVKGRIYFGANQSEGTILVTGAGTEVDFNGGVLLMATSNTSSTNNTFRVEDGAIVTNATVSIGNSNNYRASGATIALSGGGKLFTQNWNVRDGETTYIMQYLDYPAHRVEIGEGSGFHTRVLSVMGTNNVFAIDGGELEAVKYDIAGTNTFHFAGTGPKMSQFAQNGLAIGADCTFSFEIPSSGYADVPCEFWPSVAFTMPETTRLAVDATAFSRAGGGTIPLMKFNGNKTITFPDALLSRYNSELAGAGCSVSYEPSARTLVLTVRSAIATVICFR